LDGCSRVGGYPDLKSNQNFLALQSQLDFENCIAVARRDYIEAVRRTTRSCAPFPV
jgi:LemA protein